MKVLKSGDIPWMLVQSAFDWKSKEPKVFMTIEQVCNAAGFDPRPGDGISVSGFLRRMGIERLKSCGERGALMPPLSQGVKS